MAKDLHRAAGATPQGPSKLEGASKSEHFEAEVSEADLGWTFLSNHCHVLILLAREPDLSLREVSLAVGITERSVQRIVSDLEQGGFLEKQRIGRGNHYRMVKGRGLRHPIEAHCSLDDLLELINRGAPRRAR